MKSNFEIPKMILERDKQKQKEYDEREEIDVEDLDNVSREDMRSMKDLDKVLGNERFTKEGEEDEFDTENPE